MNNELINGLYKRNISDYERVPLLLENIAEVKKSIFPQVLGQWIYFRNNNIYTKELLYYTNQLQNHLDTLTLTNQNSSSENNELQINYQLCNNFMDNNNKQMLLGFRNREIENDFSKWQVLEIFNNEDNIVQYINTDDQEITNIDNFYDNEGISKFVYNNLILKYEHIS